MAHVEDLRAADGPTLRMGDEEKKKAREAIAAGYMPAWAANAEKQIGDGPFFGGAKLNVVDLKLSHVGALVRRRQGRPRPGHHLRAGTPSYARAQRGRAITRA